MAGFTSGAAEALSDAFGFLTLREVAAIKKYALEIFTAKQTAVAINFGAGAGTSGLALVEAASEAALSVITFPTIVTIDISEGGPTGGLQNERNAFDNASMLYRLPHQILGCSWEIGEAWNDKVDIVFVDGDHSREAVEKDIKAWRQRVSRGGYMMFHDYGSFYWPAVEPVVNEMMADWGLVDIVDTLAIYRNGKSLTRPTRAAKNRAR